MANRFLLKKSSVVDKIPLAIDLEYGELAINYNDGKLYYKKADNSIDTFLSKSNTGSITVTGVTSTPKILTASTATTNLDLSQADHFHITLETNTTFTISNAASKIGSNGNIVLIQDAVGGWTFIKPTEMKTPIGGAAIDQTTLANSVSVLSYYVVSANTILINYIGNFA